MTDPVQGAPDLAWQLMTRSHHLARDLRAAHIELAHLSEKLDTYRAAFAGETCPKCDGTGEGEVPTGLDTVTDGPCDLCDGRGIVA